jgi:hypothetical protein
MIEIEVNSRGFLLAPPKSMIKFPDVKIRELLTAKYLVQISSINAP